jgi:uncharacterized membrane protein
MNPLTHLHPATVHFPIALLWVASVAGLVYILWRPLPVLRVLMWATMGLGWIAAGVAILTGVLAQSGLPPQAPYRSILNGHISAAIAVLINYGALLYLGWMANRRAAAAVRPARAQKAPASPPPPDLLDDRSRRWLTAGLLVLGATLVFLTGWNGGQLVYVWGVNVAR